MDDDLINLVWYSSYQCSVSGALCGYKERNVKTRTSAVDARSVQTSRRVQFVDNTLDLFGHSNSCCLLVTAYFRSLYVADHHGCQVLRLCVNCVKRIVCALVNKHLDDWISLTYCLCISQQASG